jgi:hypothetical protein
MLLNVTLVARCGCRSWSIACGAGSGPAMGWGSNRLPAAKLELPQSADQFSRKTHEHVPL